MNFESLSFLLKPSPLWEQQLPAGIHKYAEEYFNEELMELYQPELVVLPITPEGEQRREWLSMNHYDDKGVITHQDVHCYGAVEHNFNYRGEEYLAILVNND